MIGEHLGEDAEAYAIGALSETEIAAAERHLGTCDACVAEVARAQRVAALLAQALPDAGLPTPALHARLRTSLSAAQSKPSRPRSLARLPVRSVAAALALAVVGVGAGTEVLVLHAHVARDDAALDVLLNSHFVHVAVTPVAGSHITAKVIFARDGSWLYVIAARRDGPLRAYARGRTDALLGELVASGTTETLLVRPAEPVATVVLERGSSVAGTATLAPSHLVRDR